MTDERVERGHAGGPAVGAAPAALVPTPALLDALPAATLVLDAAARVVAWNHAAHALFGWTAAEATGRDGLDLLAPAHVREPARARILAFVGRADALGQTRRFESPLLHREGRELAGAVSLAVVAGGTGRVLVAVVEDLSPRRAAEAAVREGERRLRRIVDLVPQFIFAKDTEGRFVLVNEAVARAYGTTVEGLHGRRDADFTATEEEVRHFRTDDLEVIRSGRPKTIREEVLTDATGRTRVLDTIKIPFTFHDGGEPCVLGVSTDVTERKRMEAALVQAQKMEAVGRLAGGVAHDFNNLLTAILGYTQLLEARLPEGSPLRRDTGPIREAADRATALTRQLLTFARRDRTRPQVVDLDALTAGLEPMLARLLGGAVTLDLRRAPAPLPVEIDPAQLEQVVVNLVVNARDAMPAGGPVRVALRGLEAVATAATPPEATPRPWVELVVEDQGVGIPADVLPRVFEPFFTTKSPSGGSGLGLAICYGIVERAGGRIDVESVPGRGSTFRVRLPRAAAGAEPAAPRPPPARVPRGDETVLVVDDDEPVRDVLSRALEDAGYRVLSADAPATAVQVARDHAGPIHLLVADVVMPGMSGPEVARRVQAIRPTTRVLFVSGFHDTAQGGAAVPSAEDLLPKPFTPAELARRVRAVLDRRA